MEPQPTQQTVKTENYRQQLIIPDDTNTTVANTNIEETQGSNFMEEASNHSTVIMSDKTVTSPTSQFGNLSFQPVSQEPLSFAGKNLYRRNFSLCSKKFSNFKNFRENVEKLLLKTQKYFSNEK